MEKWNIETRADEETLRALYVILAFGYGSIIVYSIFNVVLYYRKIP